MFDDNAGTRNMMERMAAKDEGHLSGYEVVSVRPEHLILLRNANVSDAGSYTGTPGLDPKRPFGNSDIEADMLELLLPDLYARYRSELDTGDEDLAEEMLGGLREDFRRLLAELTGVLQVCLDNQSFETGVFRRPRYSFAESWERLG